MENRPLETYQVHEYLRSKLCSLYENDCIFDKFECAWSGDDKYVLIIILCANLDKLNKCSVNLGLDCIALRRYDYLKYFRFTDPRALITPEVSNIAGNLYFILRNFTEFSHDCRHVITGSYNNFFRIFDRDSKKDATLEASRENIKPRTVLKSKKVCQGGRKKKDEISVDCLDFQRKILHTAWHPQQNVLAIAATNNLYLFQSKDP